MYGKIKVLQPYLLPYSYSLFEPNSRTLAEYGVRLEKAILRDSELLSEVNNAFCNSHPLLAQKVVTRSAHAAVSKISADALLAKALSVRRSQAGSLLKAIRKVNAKKLQESDILVGHRFHTAGAEPYFFDNSYTHTKQHGAISVHLNGRCVVAEEIKDRDKVKPTTRRTAHFSLEKNSKVNTKFFTSCFNTLSRRWLKKSGKNFLMTLKERRSRKHIHPPSSQLLPPPALAPPPAAALPLPALAPPPAAALPPPALAPPPAAVLPPPALAPPPAAALPPPTLAPPSAATLPPPALAPPALAPPPWPAAALPPPPPQS